MNNSEYPTFSFERKNKKKNDNKKKENTLNQIDNTFMKIFPLETKTNIEFPLPNFNDILMKISLDEPLVKKNENKLEEINKFKIDLTKKYDEIDEKIDNLNTILNLINILDDKKNYSFDVKKLKLMKEPLLKFQKFVGMKNVKKIIINQILYFLLNLDEEKDMMHTVITGPPGVGKTKLGHLLGEIYYKLGVIKCDTKKKYKCPLSGDDIDFKFKIARRSDLIGEYVGHTAVKTQKVINESLGGVLFIDEAYSLGNDDKKDIYSKECIDTINQNLTENKGKFAVIIAGYENELEKCFFNYNEGLVRRFPFKYVIESYDYKELGQIFINKLLENGWILDESLNLKDDNKLNDFFKLNYKSFKNFGGDMEILLFNSKIAHSKRIFGKNPDLRKKMSMSDIKLGYELFKNNKKKDISIPYGMYL